MIFTKQQGDLQHSINKMAIPVFVVDHDEDGQFRLVALNKAHTLATGLELEAVVKKTPHMILPNKADAEFLVGRYQTCVQQRKPITYSTRMTYQDTVKEIQTVLHPIVLEGNAPTRLVGQVAITATLPKASVRGALGDKGATAQADIHAIEAIFDNIRLRQTISSKDLMVLSVLLNNRRLSMSEVARMVEDFDRCHGTPELADVGVGQGRLTSPPHAASA